MVSTTCFWLSKARDWLWLRLPQATIAAQFFTRVPVGSDILTQAALDWQQSSMSLCTSKNLTKHCSAKCSQQSQIKVKITILFINSNTYIYIYTPHLLTNICVVVSLCWILDPLPFKGDCTWIFLSKLSEFPWLVIIITGGLRRRQGVGLLERSSAKNSSSSDRTCRAQTEF